MNPFAEEVARCRRVQSSWSRLSIRERLRPVREFRHRLVQCADDLAAAVETDIRRDPEELIATDIVPTASAAKFLERRAATLLAPRRVGDRPFWLWGCRDTVHRRPLGLVGLIGTWNYPVFLNAVPILHALAAGNGILWKPSELAPRTADVLHRLFIQSGFPADLVQKLPASREAGPLLVESEIDFLHFTGSEAVGRKLAARLGERLIPSTLELSGCDAMFVLKDANVAMAAKLAWYGTALNSGQTCMAVRRAFVDRAVYEPFVEHLRILVKSGKPVRLVAAHEGERRAQFVAEAKRAGCEVLGTEGGNAILLNSLAVPNLAANREAIFAPLLAVTPFDSIEDALVCDGETHLRLTASIFTADVVAASDLAAKLSVGSVVVNDVIVPTAHPATPFGGRGASGWGVTQGTEGLLEMTVPQVVSTREGSFRPHAESGGSADVPRGYLRLVHGRGLRERLGGFRQLARGIRGRTPVAQSVE
jgi:acyl-CoA reductase-like NAD-dependent aldehyde dehydrogenase